MISKNARRVIIDDSVLPVIISLSITYVLSNFIGLPDKMGLDDAKYNQRHNQAHAGVARSVNLQPYRDILYSCLDPNYRRFGTCHRDKTKCATFNVCLETGKQPDYSIANS